MHAQTWLSCPQTARPTDDAGRSALALAANLSMGLAPCDPALVPDAITEQTAACILSEKPKAPHVLSVGGIGMPLTYAEAKCCSSRQAFGSPVTHLVR